MGYTVNEQWSDGIKVGRHNGRTAQWSDDFTPKMFMLASIVFATVLFSQRFGRTAQWSDDFSKKANRPTTVPSDHCSFTVIYSVLCRIGAEGEPAQHGETESQGGLAAAEGDDSNGRSRTHRRAGHLGVFLGVRLRSGSLGGCLLRGFLRSGA